MIISSHAGWSTHNEMEYVKGLISGKSFDQNYVPRLEPRELMQNYLKSAKRRKAWRTYGDVNPDHVIKFVEEYLNAGG